VLSLKIPQVSTYVLEVKPHCYVNSADTSWSSAELHVPYKDSPYRFFGPVRDQRLVFVFLHALGIKLVQRRKRTMLGISVLVYPFLQ